MNKTSPTKIQVQWKPIPDTFYVHGILRGYRVLYRAVAIADETPDEKMETKVVTVSSSSLFADLENLDAYTRYEIEVLAFTIKGDGVKSEPIRAGISQLIYSFSVGLCAYAIYTSFQACFPQILSLQLTLRLSFLYSYLMSRPNTIYHILKM